jgi:hypothetical protein
VDDLKQLLGILRHVAQNAITVKVKVRVSCCRLMGRLLVSCKRASCRQLFAKRHAKQQQMNTPLLVRALND